MIFVKFCKIKVTSDLIEVNPKVTRRIRGHRRKREIDLFPTMTSNLTSDLRIDLYGRRSDLDLTKGVKSAAAAAAAGFRNFLQEFFCPSDMFKLPKSDPRGIIIKTSILVPQSSPSAFRRREVDLFPSMTSNPTGDLRIDLYEVRSDLDFCKI